MARGLSQERNTALTAPISCSGRILREILAVHSFLVNSLEFCCQFFQIISSQICIEMYALCFFHLVDDFLEVGLWNFHNNVRIHLDESAVGIVSEIAGLPVFFAKPSTATSFKPRFKMVSIIPGMDALCAGTNGNQ